jgi:hypothetical protein
LRFDGFQLSEASSKQRARSLDGWQVVLDLAAMGHNELFDGPFQFGAPCTAFPTGIQMNLYPQGFTMGKFTIDSTK